MRSAAAAHPAELVAEVIPGVMAATGDTTSATGQRVASVGAGLRCEQKCRAGAENQSQAEAGGEHTQAEPIFLPIGRGGRPEWSGRWPRPLVKARQGAERYWFPPLRWTGIGHWWTSLGSW
jgi:hypothetical protein